MSISLDIQSSSEILIERRKKPRIAGCSLPAQKARSFPHILAFLSTLPTTVNYSRLKHSKTIIQERRWWVKRNKDRIEWWRHHTPDTGLFCWILFASDSAETFCNSEAFWLQGFSQASWGGAMRKCRDKNIAISKGKQQSTNRKSPWKLKSFGKSTETWKNMNKHISYLITYHDLHNTSW